MSHIQCVLNSIIFNSNRFRFKVLHIKENKIKQQRKALKDSNIDA